jgi:hypothetical protein
VLSQFAGGMPPAIFLFLTGVTLAFLMDSSERRGLTRGQRVFAAFRRSGYLFFLAFAFRAQMFVTGFPPRGPICSRWTSSTAWAFAIAVLSVLAVFRTRQRVAAAAAVGTGDRAGRAAGERRQLDARAGRRWRTTSRPAAWRSGSFPGRRTWRSASAPAA